MLRRIRTHLSYSNVVSTLCLFALLGGGAYAADKITSKDLAKNSVKSKAIKNGQVKAKDVKNGAVGANQIADGAVGAAELGAGSVTGAALAPNSVGGGQIADGSVGGPDLAKDPAPIVVGSAGAPPFLNGGEGDCVWSDAGATASGLEPVGFQKDTRGRVFMAGIAVATQTPGAGDEECGATSPEANDRDEDAVIFVLPPAYRPANSHFLPGFNSGGATSAYVVVGQDGLQAGTSTLLPGSVYANPESSGTITQQVLNGSFPAAGSTLTRRSGDGEPDRIPPKLLRELLGG